MNGGNPSPPAPNTPMTGRQERIEIIEGAILTRMEDGIQARVIEPIVVMATARRDIRPLRVCYTFDYYGVSYWTYAAWVTRTATHAE